MNKDRVIIQNSILLAPLSPIKCAVLRRSSDVTGHGVMNIDVRVVVFASVLRDVPLFGLGGAAEG